MWPNVGARLSKKRWNASRDTAFRLALEIDGEQRRRQAEETSRSRSGAIRVGRQGVAVDADRRVGLQEPGQDQAC